LNVYFYDRYTDPYDVENLIEKDYNPNGIPYDIVGEWECPHQGLGCNWLNSALMLTCWIFGEMGEIFIIYGVWLFIFRLGVWVWSWMEWWFFLFHHAAWRDGLGSLLWKFICLCFFGNNSIFIL
jgi:hypothetical protein